MSDELTVANRNESWLKGIADGDTDSLEPMTHKELWYKAIADGEVPDFLHPVTHEELWLQKIAESGGGGGSNWELLTSDEFAVNTARTSESSVGEVSLTDALDLDKYSKNDIIVVHLRDKSGKRAGYFYGSDSFFINQQLANNGIGGMQFPAISCITVAGTNEYVLTERVGVYCKAIYWSADTKTAVIYSKYNSSSGTIDGTYKVDVYKLTLPEGMTLFE